MEDTIVIRFLKILSGSGKELTGLRFFVQNPYFNPNGDVIRLFSYLERFAPKFEDVNLTAENAFKEIYPNKTFDKRKLDSLMNRLYDVIKKFIYASGSKTNRIDVEISVLAFCKKRYPKRFDNQLRKVNKLLGGETKGSMLYQYKIVTEYEVLEYRQLNQLPVDCVPASEALDKFYWLSKLPLFAEMLNRKLIRADTHDFSEIEAYLEFVKQVGYTEVPLIQMWYCLVRIFKDIVDKTPATLADYHRFKTLFFQNLDDLHPNDKRNLYIFLRNIIRFSSFEDADYYREEFEIDQLGLKQGLIFFNGFLREFTTLNIIKSAIRLEKIRWAKDFLQQYKDVFWRRFADEILAYCEAFINFYEGKYDKALALFTEVEYNNIFFEIERRIKLIQIYYEIEDIDLFEKEIKKKLRPYISNNRNRIGDMYRQSYLDFATYARKISDTPRLYSDKISELETAIRKIPVRLLLEKKWLLDKLDELKR